jgi:DNA-binding transcriptional MerR regulator
MDVKMEYKINQLAQISGVTTRTLRYYDEMGLLSPERVSTNGYRVYRQEQVDKLQQILFYRELGVA